MDGYSVEYIYENGAHLDYSQLGMHPRGLKKLPNGQWYLVFGETGTVDVAEGMFYPMQESSLNPPSGLALEAADIYYQRHSVLGQSRTPRLGNRYPLRAGLCVSERNGWDTV